MRHLTGFVEFHPAIYAASVYLDEHGQPDDEPTVKNWRGEKVVLAPEQRLAVVEELKAQAEEQ
jgi:hypothetical protein